MKAIVTAPGKINLSLEVLGQRKDGYHAVQMIMQGVRLADYIHCAEAPANRVTANHPFVPRNESNLAMRAAMLLQERYQVPPVHLHIDKAIPVSAGMAGGSTDAAAVLLGLDRLFQLGLSATTLRSLAAELGSDVPFCLESGTALAVARGEIVAPLPPLPKMHLVVFKAAFGVSTAKVYRAYRPGPDALGPEERLRLFLEAIHQGDSERVLNMLFNALEPTTFSMYPKIERLRNELVQLGAPHVLMSGSGPTLFAAFLSAEEAFAFFKRAHALHKHMIVTSTLDAAALARDRVTMVP